MIKELQLPKESKILDVGCGPGELLFAISDDFEFLTGIDIAQEMIDIANKNLEHKSSNKNLIFELGDIENLKFDDKSFDLIICSGVIEYLANDEEWISEIKRVLRSDGYLIINVTNKYSIRKWTSGLVDKMKSSKILLNMMNILKDRIMGKGKIHLFPFKPRLHSPREFDGYLHQNGFTKINHNYFDFAVLPAPFDTLFDFITIPIKKFLERYTRKNMVFNGTGYIVKAEMNRK
jgi:ubiquinone/menaquinone biosynthesis C-methylase UbiE